MAEHQQAAQAVLALQPLEAQQGAEGFAGSGTGVDQHIRGALRVLLEAAAQQGDQLALPLARAEAGGMSGGRPAVGGDGGGNAAVGRAGRAARGASGRAPAKPQIEGGSGHGAIVWAAGATGAKR